MVQNITQSCDIILQKGKYVEAVLQHQNPGKKTFCYQVRSILYGYNLGQIKWYSPWRCYAFFPNNDCIFEPVCLTTICGWIEKLNTEQKMRVGARKERKK
jgi:hypothetical protein